MKNFEVFLDQFNHFRQDQVPMVVATLVDVTGSAPQEVGARCIIGEAGLLHGTIGGGKIEAYAIQYGRELLSNFKSESHLQKWNLQKDIGMSCGGVVSIFFEVFPVKGNWKISIFGAGHVSQALVQLLDRLDCSITVFDSRSEWLSRLPRSPHIETVCSEDLSDWVAKIPEESFVVIMTMGHAVDLPILAKAVQRNFPYVGNMGSETKARALQNDLKKLNISIDRINKFYCPIGEKIGNNTPVEIALSIVSQLLKVRDQVATDRQKKPEVLARTLL